MSLYISMSAGFSWKWRVISPFWLRSKHILIRYRRTWIKRPPEQKFSRNKAEPHTSDKWAPRAAHGTKEKVDGHTKGPADLPLGPTASSLRRGSSSLDGEVGSRSLVHNSRPSKGWLPSIYMKGGAPFQATHIHQANTYYSSYSLKM